MVADEVLDHPRDDQQRGEHACREGNHGRPVGLSELRPGPIQTASAWQVEQPTAQPAEDMPGRGDDRLVDADDKGDRPAAHAWNDLDGSDQGAADGVRGGAPLPGWAHLTPAVL